MGLNERQKKERSEYLENQLKITECSQRKPYAFISYASDNWEAVFKTVVVPMQKKYGLSVYADKAFDKVNDKWIVPMLRNIRGAKVVVAFVSQSYIESYACFLELLTAVNSNKQIVFVSLEDRLRLGDTTDQPDVERGVKNEIMNQGANIATNTNNASKDIMRAMKSAYTSLSTLLEQDALSKYDISDAFINFFRDAAVNRKTINDLNAIRRTIRSVDGQVFDKSLIVEPEPASEATEQPEISEQPEVLEQPMEEILEQPESVEQPMAETVEQPEAMEAVKQPEPLPEEPDDFCWGDEQPKKEEAQSAKSGKKEGKRVPKKLLIGAAALAVVLILAIFGLGGGKKSVTNQPYTMTDGSSAQFSGAYTGEWDKRKKWPVGNGTFVMEDNAGIYTGEWVDGVAEGQGSIKFANGDFYEGEWKAGMRTGQGKMTYADGAVYEGEWKENKREGTGRNTLLDGGYYDGEWKNGKANGQGTQYMGGNEHNKNATSYVGEFVDGKKNGYGVWTQPNGLKYEGEFKDDRWNGKGKLTHTDGSVFEGEFADGTKSGKGVYTSKDGATVEEQLWDHGAKYVTEQTYTALSGKLSGSYTGFWDFQNKQPKGQGVMTTAGGGVFEGEWKDGLLNGQGKWTRDSGDVYEGEFKNCLLEGKGKLVSSDGVVYEGEFKNGQYNGHGILTWGDGNVLEGEFKDGAPNGKGKRTNEDGSSYEGEFKDGKYDGYGVYTWASGARYEGGFKDGKEHGKGVYIYTDGTKKEGVWENGERVEG